MPAISLSSIAPMCSTCRRSSNAAPKTTPPCETMRRASAANTPPEEDAPRTAASLCCAPKACTLCASCAAPTGQRFSHRSQETHSAGSTAG